MIKFSDIKTINQGYREQFLSAVNEVIESGQYIQGQKLKEFEDNFAEYTGSSFAVGVGNGLDAITITLRAWIALGKVKEGAEVIVAANTFIATIIAIKIANLVPILVEPNPSTFNIDIDQIKGAVTSKTAVIIPVHLYGNLCDMKKISAFANENSILVLEDAAQAHGAEFDGTKSGNFGDAGAFSFYPGKNLGALGDAGIITTSCSQLYSVCKKLRNYGSDKKYEHEFLGTNSRLDDIQAAFLNIKLTNIDRDIEIRRDIAKKYLSGISNEAILLPTRRIESEHVWHLFVIRCKERDRLREFLHNNKIETIIHYPNPPHKQRALSEMSNRKLPLTEQLSKEVLSLPIWPGMADNEIKSVINIMNKFE